MGEGSSITQVQAAIQLGQRPSDTKGFPEDDIMAKVIKECWKEDNEDRLSFAQCESALEWCVLNKERSGTYDPAQLMEEGKDKEEKLRELCVIAAKQGNKVELLLDE